MASTMSRSHEGVWCLALVLLLAAAMVYGAPLSHDSSSNQPAAGETDGAMTPSVTSLRVKRQYGDITINEKLVAYLLNKHLPKNCRRVGCGSVDLQKSGRRKRSTTMSRDAMVTRTRDRIMTSELLHIFRQLLPPSNQWLTRRHVMTDESRGASRGENVFQQQQQQQHHSDVISSLSPDTMTLPIAAISQGHTLKSVTCFGLHLSSQCDAAVI